MLAAFDGRGMVAVLPEGPLAMLALVVLLPGAVFFKIVVAFLEWAFSWLFENERSSSGLG
jgi:hypothetical protein